jgi:hypothetical protein
MDTFVIISGDSDFSPLVSKLRENDKTVIGVGVKNSTSDLFINNCDEFIYYDDLVRKEPSKARRRTAAASTGAPTNGEKANGEKSGDNKGPDRTEALDLVVETFEAVAEERGENEPIWGSMIKQAIKRRHPGFNERAHGFRSFNDLLAEAQKRGFLELQADEKSGGYTVRAVDRPAPRAG